MCARLLCWRHWLTLTAQTATDQAERLAKNLKRLAEGRPAKPYKIDSRQSCIVIGTTHAAVVNYSTHSVKTGKTWNALKRRISLTASAIWD